MTSSNDACDITNCDFHFTAVLHLLFFITLVCLVCRKIALVANVICLWKPTLNKVSCILFLVSCILYLRNLLKFIDCFQSYGPFVT